MAAPKVTGLRTMSARDGVEAEDAVSSASAPGLEGFKHVFQSQKSDLWMTLRERSVHWLPNGMPREELPKTAAGNRLDMVRFRDFFFKTNDDELAELIKGSPLYGTGVWDFREKMKEHSAARAEEIRAAVASDPELAKALKLTPSDAKDWEVKPKKTEMTDEELEAATRT